MSTEKANTLLPHIRIKQDVKRFPMDFSKVQSI